MLTEYRSKFVTPEQAARAVRSGDWVDYGFGAGFPELMDRALAGRKGELKDVKIRGGLVIRPRIEVVEKDPEQTTFTYYSWHIGDYERKLQSRGLVKFLPVMLRSLPELYRSHIRVDVAFVPVSVPDEKDYCGLGISNYAWRTIFEKARTVVFEINERLPRLQGHGRIGGRRPGGNAGGLSELGVALGNLGVHLVHHLLGEGIGQIAEGHQRVALGPRAPGSHSRCRRQGDGRPDGAQ